MNVSCYFTEQEERLLRQLAREHGTAINSIIRMAFRQLVGLPNPRWVADFQDAAKRDQEGAAA